MDTANRPGLEARRLQTVVWIVTLATFGLIFDGYDLVVYGAVVSTFLRDPTQIGHVTPAIAGLLGSYALVGVMVGAVLVGLVGDVLGRRKVMLFSYAWFSVGMALTALATVFREIPSRAAIDLIDSPSARCNRRISAQSSTVITHPIVWNEWLSFQPSQWLSFRPSPTNRP